MTDLIDKEKQLYTGINYFVKLFLFFYRRLKKEILIFL